jgi:hypothetical protein
MPPGDPGVEHEQDPLQGGAIIEPPPPRIAKATLAHRQLRLNARPQLIRHDPRRNSHRHPSQLDDGCRRRSSSGNGSLHSDSISYKVDADFAPSAQHERPRGSVTAGHFHPAAVAATRRRSYLPARLGRKRGQTMERLANNRAAFVALPFAGSCPHLRPHCSTNAPPLCAMRSAHRCGHMSRRGTRRSKRLPR